MRPLRAIAVSAAAVMLLLAFTDWLGSSVSIAMLVLATVISVADNGLAFTSVAASPRPPAIATGALSAVASGGSRPTMSRFQTWLWGTWPKSAGRRKRANPRKHAPKMRRPGPTFTSGNCSGSTSRRENRRSKSSAAPSRSPSSVRT